MRSFRSKPIGWRNDSYRHYLAAKGVKTNRYYAKTFLGRLAEGAIEERERYEDLKRRQQAKVAATAPAFSAARAEQQRRAAIGVSEEKVREKLAELSERRVPVPNWMNVSSYRVGMHAEALRAERSKTGLSSEAKRRLGRKVALATKIQDDLEAGVSTDEISNAKRYEGYSRREVNEVLKDSYEGVIPRFGVRAGKEDEKILDANMIGDSDLSDSWKASARRMVKGEDGTVRRAFIGERRESEMSPEKREFNQEKIEGLKGDLDGLRLERDRVAKVLSDLQKPGEKIPGFKDVSTGKVTEFRKRK
jgi:hypothetical protein